MSLTATYDATLSRVRLAATLLGATATYAMFERTVDGFIRTVTVRGGSAVTVASQNAAVDDYEFPAGVATTYRVTSYNAADVQQAQFTAAITQDLSSVWLKVPAAPFLNQAVTVADLGSEIVRKTRETGFPIVGRNRPTSVGDVALGQDFTLLLLTETAAAARDLDYLFASGEIVFLHLPSAVEHFPGGYYAPQSPSRRSTLRLSPRRLWTVPLEERAEPGPEVIGSAYTISSVLADYATISAMMAANATIADLLARTGTPSDVLVP